MHIQRYRAFTLIELLVVFLIISLLMAILIPSLAGARASAHSAVCKSNLHQLIVANITYSDNNDGFYVPAASDMWDDSGLQRWHGLRKDKNSPFEPEKGPLAAYLGNGQIKKCPQRTGFIQGQNWQDNFERGCGGYGYNMAYIGSRLWQASIGFEQSYEQTTNTLELARPGQTLMFADTAMSKEADAYIEYSFAEPPFTVYNGRPVTTFYMSPSIHFRHNDFANCGWSDGHVNQQPMAVIKETNAYSIESAGMNLGWFQPIDNSLFDVN